MGSNSPPYTDNQWIIQLGTDPISCFEEVIEKHQKRLAYRKPAFYLSRYVIYVFYPMFSFPTMGWNWTKTSPLIHIYCSALWEDNFIPHIHEICYQFIGLMYQIFFKGDAPNFLKRAKALISLMGDWYVGEYFPYIGFWGSNTVHWLPRILPNRMVLQ